MTHPIDPAPEYVAARRALLDVLELLRPHNGSLVLVGAQAVYFHAPTQNPFQPSYTTDSDLVIDPVLITERPDIGAELLRAGYRDHTSPGTFYAPGSNIPIDLMVPAGALTSRRGRTAHLSGHDARTARRTPGLEPALLDCARQTIHALEPGDDRTASIRIAGPAALTVAKLVKLRERLGGRPDRVLTKDAADVLRLMRHCDARAIGARIRRFPSEDSSCRKAVMDALDVLRDSQTMSQLSMLAAGDLTDYEPRAQVATAFTTLAGRLLAAAE